MTYVDFSINPVTRIPFWLQPTDQASCSIAEHMGKEFWLILLKLGVMFINKPLTTKNLFPLSGNWRKHNQVYFKCYKEKTNKKEQEPLLLIWSS